MHFQLAERVLIRRDLNGYLVSISGGVIFVNEMGF